MYFGQLAQCACFITKHPNYNTVYAITHVLGHLYLSGFYHLCLKPAIIWMLTISVPLHLCYVLTSVTCTICHANREVYRGERGIRCSVYTWTYLQLHIKVSIKVQLVNLHHYRKHSQHADIFIRRIQYICYF